MQISVKLTKLNIKSGFNHFKSWRKCRYLHSYQISFKPKRSKKIATLNNIFYVELKKTTNEWIKNKNYCYLFNRKFFGNLFYGSFFIILVSIVLFSRVKVRYCKGFCTFGRYLNYTKFYIEGYQLLLNRENIWIFFIVKLLIGPGKI